MQPEIDLSGLRDLHALSEPDFWPLAVGWWFVLTGIILVMLCCVVGYEIWHKKPVVYARRKVKIISQEISDDLVYLKKLSLLLRRVAIAVDGRQAIAPLSDEKWQKFLETRVLHVFTEKEAKLIAFAPYEVKLENSVDRSILMKHALEWIKKIFKNKKSS